MMEEFLRDPRLRERARTSLSGPHLDGFSEWLRDIGYASKSIQDFLRTAVHVGLWVESKQAPLGALDEVWMERFRLHFRNCLCLGPRPQRARGQRLAAHAARFLQDLRERGIVAAAPPLPAPEIHPLVAGLEAWMRQHRGATPTTLRIYSRIVTAALQVLGDDPAAFEARSVRDFVLRRSSEHGRSKAKLVMTAMRAFLRYLVARGECRPGLEGAVPTIAGWRLASLPRYLSTADVARVIETCDPTTTAGARNRAILLLMARLGLRAGDVAALCLEDFDWSGGALDVSGKSRRATRLPLPQEVGDAVLAYLPLRCPKDSTDRVFLRRAPPRGAIASGTVSSIATRAMRVAGIVAPPRGAYVLRHSAAAALLRQGAGADLVTIQAWLGHAQAATTHRYAEANVEMMRRALELAGVSSAPTPQFRPTDAVLRILENSK